jgi:DNA-binding MarR family transcriptional regulator
MPWQPALPLSHCTLLNLQPCSRPSWSKLGPHAFMATQAKTELNPAAEPAEQGQAHNAALKLEEFLPYQLNVASNLVSQALSRIYVERYGIGVPEWRVLVTLGQFGVMTGKAVGAHSHMHKTKVSRAVANLEKIKLVQRRSNKSDLRESLLSLTPEGRAIYNDLAPGARDFAERLLDAIDPTDRPAFARALRQLIARAMTLAAKAERGEQD